MVTRERNVYGPSCVAAPSARAPGPSLTPIQFVCGCQGVRPAGRLAARAHTHTVGVIEP